jgi:nicotinamidase-related amidase
MSQGFARTAAVAVDLQKDCIDPEGSWPIHNRENLLTNAATALHACREAGIPIIYTQHWLDPRGIDALRREPLENGRPLHGVAGDPNAEIHPALAPQPVDIQIRKQRWSGFYQTNLDLVLRRMDVEHLIMFGVWSEACLETTVWDAIWRDYRITLVKDACGTATELMHMTAMLDLANWLYDGAIVEAAELAKALKGEPHRMWRFERPAAFAYTLENIRRLYDSI